MDRRGLEAKRSGWRGGVGETLLYEVAVEKEAMEVDDEVERRWMARSRGKMMMVNQYLIIVVGYVAGVRLYVGLVY